MQYIIIAYLDCQHINILVQSNQLLSLYDVDVPWRFLTSSVCAVAVGTQ